MTVKLLEIKHQRGSGMRKKDIGSKGFFEVGLNLDEKRSHGKP
jgi:hypothetical protein